MTRRLAAKVASAVRQRFVKSSSMATFKRVRRRVISAAAPLGKATGFCVTREAPGRFGRKVSTGFGPARKYFSPNVFGGLVKIRDKLSLKIRDKGVSLRGLTPRRGKCYSSSSFASARKGAPARCRSAGRLVIERGEGLFCFEGAARVFLWRMCIDSM